MTVERSRCVPETSVPPAHSPHQSCRGPCPTPTPNKGLHGSRVRRRAVARRAGTGTVSGVFLPLRNTACWEIGRSLIPLARPDAHSHPQMQMSGVVRPGSAACCFVPLRPALFRGFWSGWPFKRPGGRRAAELHNAGVRGRLSAGSAPSCSWSHHLPSARLTLPHRGLSSPGARGPSA